MKFVPCSTPESINRLVELVKSYTHVYGVDVVECGTQELQIAFITHYNTSNTKVILGELVDDDGEMLSMAGLYFAETVPAGILRSVFHTKIGLERYDVTRLAHECLVAAAPIILERGATEFYWVQRAGRARQLNDMLTLELSPGNILDGWAYRDFEHLEPFGRAENELLGTYLLGPMNGIIPKPMVIKQLYKKDAYRQNK